MVIRGALLQVRIADECNRVSRNSNRKDLRLRRQTAEFQWRWRQEGPGRVDNSERLRPAPGNGAREWVPWPFLSMPLAGTSTDTRPARSG